MLNLKEFYDSIHQKIIKKKFFDESTIRRCYLILNVLKKFFDKPILLLDLGPGFGYITREIGKRHNVIALELSSVAIKVAKKICNYTNVKFVQGNIENGLPFQTEIFDGVICGELVEHIVNTPLFFQEVRRVLKRSGILIITTQNYSSLSFKIKYLLGRIEFLNPEGEHVRFYTDKSLRNILSKYGFKIKKFLLYGKLKGAMFVVAENSS